jgi:ABC-type cobalamin/Fe3+-siderophores transport system ATPase subunit
MIRRVIIEGFKRFDRIEFALPGHIVLAGPNNTGKTTILQAIAAWGLALRRWKELNDFQRHGGAYARAPIARQAFSAVPLRAFDLLWRDRQYHGRIGITLGTDDWALRMDLEADSTEQIYVRPEAVDPAVVRKAGLTTVFVPPMTGLSVQEPVYQQPLLAYRLGEAKPGEIIRNLLVQASQSETAWPRLQESLRRLFGFDLLPPDASGPFIVADYRSVAGGAPLDISSAGSGFQQVLLLLTLLNAHPASVLLLDEPDAHLHVFLQEAIFAELRSTAARVGSQLVVATHSEVIINAVDARELCILLDRPRLLATEAERGALTEALRVLSNDDLVQALEAPGVLYLEDYTDLAILREWARVLGHPAYDLLHPRVFWRKVSAETAGGTGGIKARDHYAALHLVRDLPALELVDGDSHPGIQSSPITGHGFQRLRWRRYEIESYLVHPAALARFVARTVGEAGAGPHLEALTKHLRATLPPPVLDRPLDEHPYLNDAKARKTILPPALNAAGLPNLPYTRYYEIAAGMLPEEIHPEVREKLDQIVAAFKP